MRVLLLFLDGIGLGEDDPDCNPFAAAQLPTLESLSGGYKWLRSAPRLDSGRATFIPTDARLGVTGRPQSATGQATILTGRNVPAELGEHYGPYPDERIRAILAQDNLYTRLVAHGLRCGRLDAHPPHYLAELASGKRLRTAMQHAAYVAGVPLPSLDALQARRALSPDFLGDGWRDVLNLPDVPVHTPREAGALLADLACQHDFSLFSTWLTDEIGHHRDLERGIAFLERFDAVLAALLDAWDDSQGLIVITSDHGNLEDLSHRKHTENPVPTVVIGAARHSVAEQINALTDLTPAILRLLI
ncbi:MAG: alkaline phosphatase family protein [Anaerolineae bacterium]|nr:alkaline phosphatase family protein [Anaerolineae bacterium]